jgi:RimJ/RimL family protein N-acetyltransferase
MAEGAHLAGNLRALVDEGVRLLAGVPEERTLLRPASGGWSTREIIGHLIDSACNNHRRFVINQSRETLHVEPYAQDGWVDCQRHADRPAGALIDFWAAYNRHLAHLIEVMPEDVLLRTRGPAAAMGFGYTEVGDAASLRLLIEDYIGHIRHHLAQVRALLEPVPRFPFAVGDPVGTVAPAARPGDRVLEGRRFDLRPLDPARDGDALFAAGHSGAGTGDIWVYLPYGPFEDAAAMRAWLEACAASRDIVFYTVVERATGRAAGMCSYLNIDQAMGRVELGHIWYTTALHGSGISADVAVTMMTEAFDRLGYRRVEWKCDALNQRSRRAALNLGFSFEGVTPQHMIVKGRNRDSAWFSLVDRDWPAAKARLVARTAREDETPAAGS